MWYVCRCDDGPTKKEYLRMGSVLFVNVSGERNCVHAFYNTMYRFGINQLGQPDSIYSESTTMYIINSIRGVKN